MVSFIIVICVISCFSVVFVSKTEILSIQDRAPTDWFIYLKWNGSKKKKILTLHLHTLEKGNISRILFPEQQWSSTQVPSQNSFPFIP